MHGPSRALTTGLLLAMSLHAAHGLAVVTALPAVARALDGHALYGASIAAYLLASLVGIAAAGRAGDLHGLARPFGRGLLLFALGLTGAGLAPSMPAFVAARALEGLGGGMLSAVLYATVSRAVPEPERPRLLAWLSAAWVVPGIVAPPLAGAIAEAFGWRPVFLLLLPGVAVCAALVLPPLVALPRARAAETAGAGSTPADTVLRDALRLAVGGALLLAASSAQVSFATLVAGGAGAAVGLPALLRLLPSGTAVAAPGLPAAIATKTLFSFAFFAVDVFLPLALVEVQGRSIAFAGLLMTAGALSWTAGAFVQARFAARASAALLSSASGAVLLTGLLMTTSVLTPGASLVGVVAGWTLAGLGMGIGTNTTNATAMARTRAGSEGATSTALGMADALGVAAATGIGGAVMAAGLRAGADTGASLGALFGLAIAAVFLLAPAGWRMDVRTHPGATPADASPAASPPS